LFQNTFLNFLRIDNRTIVKQKIPQGVFFVLKMGYNIYMDIFAHTLWANAGARGANAILEKKDKNKLKISPAWTGFFGVAPDFFAFTIPFLILFYNIILGKVSFSKFDGHHMQIVGFDLAAYLYQFSHSLVIFFLVFILVWVLYKRPRYELLGWALHILIDIPSHSAEFYPTPFLFPISDYKFLYGISWGNTYYMLINYTALLLVWGFILVRNLKNKRAFKNSLK
jgi:fumarate reductase subunit D